MAMIPAEALPPAGPLEANPVRIDDVPGWFRALNPRGEYMAVRGGVMDPLLYTTGPENADGFHNHFQGMQRLNDGRHMVISGSNWQAPPRGSEIYIASLGSRRQAGPWLSNISHASEPPEEDRVVMGITVDPVLWHSGGMDVLGPVLAVPVEHNERQLRERVITGSARPPRKNESAICFFDVSDPTAPRFFGGPDQRIRRMGVKAGAAALTRLPNGHYLCGAWSDDDSLPDGKKRPMYLDLYLSESPIFDGRFRQQSSAVQTWIPKPRAEAERGFSFQAINFVHDVDGRLYLVGFCLDDPDHCVELYTFDIPNAHQPPAKGAGIEPPVVKRLQPRITVRCGHSHCDLRGAGGAFVSKEGLFIYSGAQYRGKKAGAPILFCEFRAPLSAVADVTLSSAWVELYDGPRMEGATLTLRDLSANGTIENYEDVKVAGRHFGDRVRSARYQLPEGARYVLYRNHGFKEPLAELRGTGRVEHDPDFDARGIGGTASSSRLEGV